MPHTIVSLARSALLHCTRACLLVVAAIALAATASAQGVNSSVRSACTSDYFALCSKHAVGSPSLRSCMSSNGPKLSSRCLNALVAAGEVTPKTVAKRKALAGAN